MSTCLCESVIEYTILKKETMIRINRIQRVLPVFSILIKIIFCVEFDELVLDYYGRRKDWKTSNLGTYLFKNIGLENEPRFVPKNRSYFVLQWMQWGYDSNNSVYHLKGIPNPLKGCSVQNCIFSDDRHDFDMADAVVINIRHVDMYLPPMETRNPKQLWVWMSEEPPVYNNLAEKLADLADIYNWSMSYRSDSEIPMPYGRTLPRPIKLIDDVSIEDYMVQLVPNWNRKRRDVIAAILVSHCTAKYRLKYLKELQKYMKVDVYGMCSDNPYLRCKCLVSKKTYYKTDCHHLNQYLFYLVFENSRCRQYLSEKTFHHAFSKGAIPVIMGPPKEDCVTLLPPNSFLHVDTYNSPKELAEHMMKIITYNDTILWYHRWRNHFTAENEHGYFGTPSLPLCRICEALNYNEEDVKFYTEDDLRIFLEPRLLCVPPYEGYPAPFSPPIGAI